VYVARAAPHRDQGGDRGRRLQELCDRRGVARRQQEEQAAQQERQHGGGILAIV